MNAEENDALFLDDEEFLDEEDMAVEEAGDPQAQATGAKSSSSFSSGGIAMTSRDGDYNDVCNNDDDGDDDDDDDDDDEYDDSAEDKADEEEGGGGRVEEGRASKSSNPIHRPDISPFNSTEDLKNMIPIFLDDSIHLSDEEKSEHY
jgi:hypothetical protein